MKKSCMNCMYSKYDFDCCDDDIILTCHNNNASHSVVNPDFTCDYFKEIKLEDEEIELEKIKKYELSSDISIEKLKEAGFEVGVWIEDVSNPKMYISMPLYDEIDIHIEIAISEDGSFVFDDSSCIYVIDDSFGQPYMPFYKSDVGFKYLNEVIKAYNIYMDSLVELGILKEKKKEKTRSRKK